MPLYSVIVVNTAPGCDNLVQQQVSADTCTNFIVRITPNTNAVGPFNVYLDSTGTTAIWSAQTRTQMINGVVVSVGPCTTPTPTITPTFTPTPSTTPPNTPTPTVTPTFTETPPTTPTTTPTVGASPTPTETVTTTPTETPTLTPTITQTTTPTFTPTPSPTTAVLEILIMDQNGNVIITQDGNPIILQQIPTSYLVSSGETSQPGCIDPQTLTQTIYSASLNWEEAVRFFSDSSLTTPFNGGDYWYTSSTNSLTGYWQIDNDGFVVGYIWYPC